MDPSDQSLANDVAPGGQVATAATKKKDRERRLVWFGLATITVTTSLASYVTIIREILANPSHIAADFIVFWTAAQADHPYDFAALTAAQHWYVGDEAIRPFAYPPSFLPWLTPFSGLAMLAGFAIWLMMTTGLFAFAWSRIVGWRHIATALAAPVVLLAAIPGQVTLLMGAMLAGGLAAAPRRPLLAGVLLGLAATIKPQAMMLLPLALAAAGHWRALAASTLVGAVTGLAWLAIQGPWLWIAWLESLPAFMAVIREGGMIHFGITPASAMEQAGITGPAALAFIAAMGALGLVTIWYSFRHCADASLRITAFTAGTLLVLPYAMPYELALAAPAAAALLFSRKRDPASATIGLLTLTAVGGTLGLVATCGLIMLLVRRGDCAEAARERPVPVQA